MNPESEKEEDRFKSRRPHHLTCSLSVMYAREWHKHHPQFITAMTVHGEPAEVTLCRYRYSKNRRVMMRVHGMVPVALGVSSWFAFPSAMSDEGWFLLGTLLSCLYVWFVVLTNSLLCVTEDEQRLAEGWAEWKHKLHVMGEWNGLHKCIIDSQSPKEKVANENLIRNRECNVPSKSYLPIAECFKELIETAVRLGKEKDARILHGCALEIGLRIDSIESFLKSENQRLA